MIVNVGGKKLAASPRQCARSFCPPDPSLPGQKRHSTCSRPPYSPDMAPCDFWLFPKLKIILKEKR
ncbi:hypothetical protein SK128_022869, partial [Halocaridina rubra]